MYITVHSVTVQYRPIIKCKVSNILGPSSWQPLRKILQGNILQYSTIGCSTALQKYPTQYTIFCSKTIQTYTTQYTISFITALQMYTTQYAICCSKTIQMYTTQYSICCSTALQNIQHNILYAAVQQYKSRQLNLLKCNTALLKYKTQHSICCSQHYKV